LKPGPSSLDEPSPAASNSVCRCGGLADAVDVTVAWQMVKKKLTEYLIALLDRVSYDLLLLVITFIKKLSIYEENMIQARLHSLALITDMCRCVVW
jgi:hypothetical protein